MTPVKELTLAEHIRQQYVGNFKLSISFGILLVFVFFFLQFPNMALLNGALFFDYSFAALPFSVVIAQVVAALGSLAMFSILLTLLILGVRNDLSHIKVHYYLREMVQKFFLTMFIYFFLLAAVFILVVVAGIVLGINPLWVSILLWLISLSLVFVPQSIVIDEKPIMEAIPYSWYAILSRPTDFLSVLVVSTIAVGILPLIEFAVNSFVGVGSHISIILMFVFVIPLVEIMKTILYMNRFELVRGHEYAHKKHSGLRGFTTSKK